MHGEDAVLPPLDQIAAYVLGGGASRRMGTSKIRLVHEGRAVVASLAERLLAVVSEVVLVVKESEREAIDGLRCVLDAEREHAAVHGVRAALEASGPAWRLVLACDMPDVDAEVLRVLWRTARDGAAPGACIRRFGRRHPEPFPSLWHRDVAGRLRPEWGLTARDWLRRAGLAVYASQGSLDDKLVNLNTPEEWSRWSSRSTHGVEP